MGGTGGGLGGLEEKAVRGLHLLTCTQVHTGLGSRAGRAAIGWPFTRGTASSLWPSGLRMVSLGPEETDHPSAAFTQL